MVAFYPTDSLTQLHAAVSSTIDPGVAITVLHNALSIQTTYGAVLLSFLGALHWGFEFAGYGGAKGYPRLLLGAAPVVFGWSTLALDPMSGLIAQWAGFTTLWWADMKATNAGWGECLRTLRSRIKSLNLWQLRNGTPNIASTFLSLSEHASSALWQPPRTGDQLAATAS